MPTPLRVLYIYAEADAPLRRALEEQLAVFRRNGQLAEWGAAWLLAGDQVLPELMRQLREADVLVPIVSAALFSSDRDYQLLLLALRRHDDEGTPLVPIIAQPVMWQVSPLGGLKVLPREGKPVTSWSNPAEAWLDVVAGLRQHIEGRGDSAAGGGTEENPYRGLAAFQEEHAPLFFGREALTRQLWQSFFQLHGQKGALRLLSILGPSGSGKSSVARAGLVPLLRREPMPGWKAPRFITLTPGERPTEKLARSLAALLPGDELRPAVAQDIEEKVLRRRSDAGAYEGLRRFASNLPSIEEQPLIVVVDQFEEVYSQCKSEAERDLFVALLLHATADVERHVSVVITLRSDFFDETRRHQELNPMPLV